MPLAPGAPAAQRLSSSGDLGSEPGPILASLFRSLQIPINPLPGQRGQDGPGHHPNVPGAAGWGQALVPALQSPHFGDWQLEQGTEGQSRDPRGLMPAGRGCPQPPCAGVCWGLIPGKLGAAATAFSRDRSSVGFCGSTQPEPPRFPWGKRILQQVAALRGGWDVAAPCWPDQGDNRDGGTPKRPQQWETVPCLSWEGDRRQQGVVAAARVPLGEAGGPQPTMTQTWKEMLRAR